jgi:sulfur carrier protein
MRLTINGSPSELPDGTRIGGILDHYNVNTDGVVVALNSRILKRAEWEETSLQNDDTLELISFVGGG